MAGVPEIQGEPPALTVIVNAGSFAVSLPSDTAIVIARVVPSVARTRRAVEAGRCACRSSPSVGRPLTPKPRASPLASLAVGWKLYSCPVAAAVVGVPEIVGATFWACAAPAASTPAAGPGPMHESAIPVDDIVIPCLQTPCGLDREPGSTGCGTISG